MCGICTSSVRTSGCRVLDLLQGVPAVNGRADDRHVRGTSIAVRRQLAHHHGIVDHQDANLLADHGVSYAARPQAQI